jgi:hypothetical protein
MIERFASSAIFTSTTNLIKNTMKSVISKTLILLFAVCTYAQEGINYKALIKDGGGALVAGQMITVQFQILQGAGMTNVYQETHTPTTDANGIIVINIGDGAVNSGVFDDINWGGDDHFLNTQINIGDGLVDMGTTAFNAVPYALSAKTVENITEIDPKVASILTNTVPKWNGTALVDGLITDDGAKVSIAADASINNITVGKGGSNVSHNTAIGFQSLQSNTTGDANTAIGYQSLFMNIDGIRNTANGEWALFSNESGNENTASGFHSMSSNLSGFNNSAHGNFSLRANSSGHSNVAMGYRALEFNFSGTFNTAIGNRAGLNSLGTGNVFLGNEAGFSETGSDKLYIDNSNTSDPLLYGDFATNELQVNGSLNINGAYYLPTADGTVNYVMSTDGAGNASWIDPTTFTSAAPTGVEAIDEGNGNGLVKTGRVDDNYGDVGSNAVDLSTSTNLSLTKGATGQYSAAMGVDTEASGFTSTAIGQGTIASGGRSTAMGIDTEASGNTSLAMGFGSTSAGQTSIAMGYFTNSLGQYSTALGVSTVARAYNVLAIGRFNVGGGTTDGWVETDPLFEIGNGSGAAAADRSNALTILKNGTITAPSLDISEITDAKTLVTKEFADANYIDAGFSGDYNDLSNLPVLFTTGDETDPKVASITTNSVPVWDGSSLVDGSLTDVSGNVGIGTASPSANLDIEGSFQFKDGTEGEAKLLTSDAQGNAIWQELNAVSILGAGGLPAPDFSCMSSVSSETIGTRPLALAVSGNYTYVVDSDTDDLKVIDVSDVENPMLVGALGLGSKPRSITVTDNYAYIMDSGSDDIKVVDIGDPTNPTLTASVSLGSASGTPNYMTISGSYAYITDVTLNYLKVVDISTPSAPVVAGSVTYGSSLGSVAVSGNYAYTLDSANNRFQVIDVSDPGSPTVSSARLSLGAHPFEIKISGNYAYVSDIVADDIKVIDISTPTSPSIVSTFGVGTRTSSMEIAGNYMYLTDFDLENVSIIDISNPLALSNITSITVDAQPEDVVVSGNYAYVVDSTSHDIKVIQLSCASALGVYPDGTFSTVTETDPIYSAWDKSTGITITESQISDLNHFTTGDETDPKVASITTNSVPVWDGTSLVDGSVTDDNGDIGINTTAPSQALDVDGQIRMRTGATNGFVPLSSSDGTMTWVDPASIAITEIQTLTDVVALGNSVDSQLKNLTDPTDAQDAATKAYIDTLIATFQAQITTLSAQVSALQSPAAVGDLRAGGVVFWVDSTGLHGLVCALSDYGTTVEWGCYGTDLPNVPNVPYNGGNPSGLGAEIGDGINNTNNILNDCPSAPAAVAARSLGPEWFLPSAKELNQMYINKTTLEDAAGFTAFSSSYWSSTENNIDNAWFQIFINGYQSDYNKNDPNSVRAVRAF